MSLSSGPLTLRPFFFSPGPRRCSSCGGRCGRCRECLSRLPIRERVCVLSSHLLTSFRPTTGGPGGRATESCSCGRSGNIDLPYRLSPARPEELLTEDSPFGAARGARRAPWPTRRASPGSSEAQRGIAGGMPREYTWPTSLTLGEGVNQTATQQGVRTDCPAGWRPSPDPCCRPK